MRLSNFLDKEIIVTLRDNLPSPMFCPNFILIDIEPGLGIFVHDIYEKPGERNFKFIPFTSIRAIHFTIEKKGTRKS